MNITDTDFTDDIIEKLILKKCLTDKKFLGKFSSIYDKRWIENPNISCCIGLCLCYFKKYGELARTKVLTAMSKKLSETNKKVDNEKILAELESTSRFDIEASDQVVNANITKFRDRKALFWTISDNIKEITENKNVDLCLKRFEDIRKMDFDDKNLGMDFFSKESQEQFWNYIKNPEKKIKTLWSRLDDKMNGGLLKEGKELTCFCAQAGLGKSLFLSNLSVNLMKQNLSVVVISLEMSENVYASRFVAHISEDNINELKRTSETTKDKVDRFYKEHPNANLFIKEYPPRTIRSRDIEDYLDCLIENGKHFDAVIVDYLGLVLPNTKSDTMYQSALQVSEELRAMSYKYSVPFVTAVQTATSGMNNEDLGMQDVAESRGICHTLDQLFGIFQTDDDRSRGNLRLRILKNRAGGEVGKVLTFHMDYRNLTLHDLTFNMNPSDDSSESDAIVDEISRDTQNIQQAEQQLSDY